MAQWPTGWPNQAPDMTERTWEGRNTNANQRIATTRYPQAAHGHEQNNPWQAFHSGGLPCPPVRDAFDMTHLGRALTQSPQVLHIRNQLSETQSQLSDAISERMRTPDSQVQTMRELSGKIERLQHEMSLQALALKQQQAKLHEKDEMISQQAEALSAQYNNSAGWQKPMFRAQTPAYQPHIQGPASVPPWSDQPHQYAPSKPASGPLLQRWNTIQGQPAATPTVPAVQPPQLLHDPIANIPNFPPPGTRQQNRPAQGMVDERGSPMHRRGLSESTNPFLTPSGTTNNHSTEMANIHKSGSTVSSRQMQSFTAPPPSRNSDRPQSAGGGDGASLALSTMSGTDDMREVFQDLIDNVVAFAYTYVNWPTTAGDKNLPQFIKDIVKDATHQKHAHRLIKTGETRYFVISKIMLTWMWKNILHPESFFGLDEELERIIRHHREQIKTENCAAPVRYIHLSHIAAQFQQLRTNPGYSRHMKMLSEKRASDLFAIIQPLAHLHKPGEWEQFHALIKQAHKVAETLFGGHTEYWWKFPDMSDPFCADTMTNLDKSTRLIPAEIEAQRIRVRVAATPHIRARKTHKDGRTMQLDLVKATVLPNYVSSDKRTENTGN